MGSVSKRSRRYQLMKKHPFCHWCQKRLVMPPKAECKAGSLPTNYPTIDHLNSRFFQYKGKRKEFTTTKERIVLACPPCNFERERQVHLKHKWLMRWKAAQYPYPFRWFGRLLRFIRGHKRFNTNHKEYMEMRRARRSY